jgi:hypothetical protein
MSFLGAIGSIDPVGVKLTSGNAAHPNVPHVPSPVPYRVKLEHPGGRLVPKVVEELKSDPGDMAAEESKVDPVTLGVRSHRKGRSYPHSSVVRDTHIAPPISFITLNLRLNLYIAFQSQLD